MQIEAGQRSGDPLPVASEQPQPSLLQDILDEAARLDASHVHIDPAAARSVLAFRVGGLIHPYRELSREDGALLVRQVALAAELALQARLPQQGRLQARDEAFEVSLLPVLHGVRVVLRRAAVAGGHRQLDALGMSSALANDMRAVLAGHGLVLVAAPEGNGRDVTLRALLGLAATRTRPGLAVAAAGLEDQSGVTRADVDAVAPADALRAGIDQDFDVLMIDSLADRRAATAAVQAAQEGRLVLAGIAAANAVAAIQQMREWRVEAFHLASTLTMAVAQRLVRRLCSVCREPVQASGSVSALLGFDPGAIVYAPAGCPACAENGFVGDTGVFESIRGDATMRRLINDGGDAAILARHAFISAPNLGSAARALARTGVTTPEEAVRISRG